MLKNNYFIINRVAEAFVRSDFTKDAISFYDENDDRVAVMHIDENVYATLFCDEVCNVTFIIDLGNVQDVITVLWKDEVAYIEFKQHLISNIKLELSKQNIKINRYAESIAEKLANGVKLRVTEAADNSDMIECPECGMMNTKGSPYCMDCGADL